MAPAFEVQLSALPLTEPVAGRVKSAVTLPGRVIASRSACGRVLSASTVTTTCACRIVEPSAAFAVRVTCSSVPVGRLTVPSAARCAGSLEVQVMLDPFGPLVGSVRSPVTPLTSPSRPGTQAASRAASTSGDGTSEDTWSALSAVP